MPQESASGTMNPHWKTSVILINVIKTMDDFLQNCQAQSTLSRKLLSQELYTVVYHPSGGMVCVWGGSPVSFWYSTLQLLECESKDIFMEKYSAQNK